VDINVRFLFSADADIEQKVQRGEFRQDLFYRISSFQVYIPPLRERKLDILPLLRFFARLYNLQLDLSEGAKKILLNHHWQGNIREMDNFLNNISVLKTRLTDEEVDELVKHSSDFIDTQKRRELPLAELEREYIYYLLKKYKDKVKVAKILNISRKTLYNKLNKYEKD
jgi:DNA-binding NtrC family response regulator